jgi:major membrane immunogen (membrane-anchored lipoprotein)
MNAWGRGAGRWSGSLAVMVAVTGLSSAGCGGAICDATAADLEGTYTIEIRDDDGDVEGRVVLEIDAEGKVTADIYDSGGDRDGSLDCEV